MRRIGVEWLDCALIALLAPGENGEEDEQTRQTQKMLWNPSVLGLVSARQVKDQVLNLAWKNHAYGKDAAPAQGLWSVGDQWPTPGHCILRRPSCPSSPCQQTQRTECQQTTKDQEGNRCCFAR